MYIVFVTHASAEKEDPRALTEEGKKEALSAASRIKELLQKLKPSVEITKLVSSPKLRCTQTINIVAKELIKNGLIKSGRIGINKRTELGVFPIDAHSLQKVLKEEVIREEGAMLVGVHADLGNALPVSTSITGRSPEGFFASRPVIAILNYSKNIVEHCETYSPEGWQPLI
jgi:hypothetical protein